MPIYSHAATVLSPSCSSCNCSRRHMRRLLYHRQRLMSARWRDELPRAEREATEAGRGFCSPIVLSSSAMLLLSCASACCTGQRGAASVLAACAMAASSACARVLRSALAHLLFMCSNLPRERRRCPQHAASASMCAQRVACAATRACCCVRQRPGRRLKAGVHRGEECVQLLRRVALPFCVLSSVAAPAAHKRN